MEKKNFDRRVLLAGVGGAIAGSMLARPALAGQLNPPPGAVGPTGRTNSEIAAMIARTPGGISEPRMPVQGQPAGADCQYLLSSPGSYYLTDNIQGVGGVHGIRIASPNVDLHLGGFHMLGAPPNGLPQGSAIVCDQSNVTVYDGTVVGWGRGVDFEHASLFIVWDVTSINSSSGGFFLGDRGQAYDCDCYSSGGNGFTLSGVRSLVEQCGVWTCPIAFKGINSPNLLIGNCATECGTAFDLGQGNAYGPIVFCTGDIGAIPNSGHPEANYVY
ncbi:MAG TPA: hypothetical protein VFV19_16570 [Candidatus Polarisedimenticolaceae bacterium]|nr:hypothetical protein [Candidatus Polarisedimenticolaceae bacterium]